MRAFVAIDLSDGVRAALGQMQAQLRAALRRPDHDKRNRGPEIRWSRPEGIHLTLKFLGEISDVQVKQVSESLAALGGFKTFPIEVKGFGFFPGPARPRVFWAGVEAPPYLAQLAGRVEESMEAMGFPREQRDFNPHLTLARFKDPRPLPELMTLVEQQGSPSFGKFSASEYFLFESKLSPHGSEYRKVARFPS